MGARYVSRSSFMPGVIQVAKCVVGSATDIAAAGYTTDQEGVVVLGTGLTSDVNTTGTFAIFYVPFGTVVTDMVINKVTGASAANMTIGDTDVDGFAEAHGLLSTAAGKWDMKVSTGAEAYIKGRWYTSTGDTFDTDNMFVINAVISTAGLTTGKFDVYLHYFNSYETRLP